MNFERIATVFLGGVVTVAILTNVFGRSNTPRVFDAIGRMLGGTISAALGAGADIR